MVSLEDAEGEQPVAVLQVPASRQPVATSDGRVVVRYTDTQGKPGCRPLYPYELAGWRADRGSEDVSAHPVVGTSEADLDPLEFVRLRRMVEAYHGDAALLGLSDQELAQALGLVTMVEGNVYRLWPGCCWSAANHRFNSTSRPMKWHFKYCVAPMLSLTISINSLSCALWSVSLKGLRCAMKSES